MTAVQFYDELEDQSRTAAFDTRLSSQDQKTKNYSNRSPGFLENDAKIAAAMTALSLDTEDFSDAALT